MAAFERGKPGPTRAPPPRRPVPPTLSRSNSGQPPNRPPRNNSSEDVASAGSLPTRGKLLPPRRRPPVPRSATTEIDISSAPPPKPISTRILPPPRKNSPGATTPPCSPTGPPPRPNPFADAPPPKPAPVRVQSSSAIGRLTPPKPQQPGAPPRRNPSPRTQAPPPTIASAPPPKPVVSAPPPKPAVSAPPPKPAVSAPPPKPVQVAPAAVIPPKIATNNVAPPSKPQYKSAAPRPGKPVGEPNNRPQSSFEKVTPSNRTNQQGNFSKISPQRGGPPERKRAPPPPVSSEPSRFTSNLGINKAVLESAKADSTVKGQLISAEKNFILMCTSGLETYANNNQNLSTYDKECLFANLDSIIKAHTDVLASVSDSSTASDLLLSLVPHLHLYLSYIANMSKAFETLSNLRERNVFLDVTQKDTLHAQTIEALLERPKQYLEAYPSAISTLMERVDPNCEEHGRLQQALQAFEYVQRQVEKRDVLPKHLTNSWDIVQSFDQSENLQLGDNRELYMEDYATLVESNDSSRKVGEKMRILVFKGLIILAASVNQYLWGSVIKGGLENIVVHEVDKWDNCLEFVHQNKSYTVNVDSKAKWMNYLPVQYPNGRKPLAFKLEF